MRSKSGPQSSAEQHVREIRRQTRMSQTPRKASKGPRNCEGPSSVRAAVAEGAYLPS